VDKIKVGKRDYGEIFEILGCINHSCFPNAMFDWNNTTKSRRERNAGFARLQKSFARVRLAACLLAFFPDSTTSSFTGVPF